MTPVAMLALASALLGLGAFQPGQLMTVRHELTFADRVSCQRAIESVYYSHQEGAKRSFESAVPDELVERKVRTSLKQSVALAQLWSSPVTERALRGELSRIRQASRLPDRLHEIEQALGQDPVLLLECFVRPVLVERLIRNFYDFDERVHGSGRREAERLRADLVEGGLSVDDARPMESISPVNEERWGFVVESGAARYSVPKRPWAEWWRDVEGRFDEGDAVTAATSTFDSQGAANIIGEPPACLPDDTWDNGSLTAVPRWTLGPGVWTGTHMLVGGGDDGGQPVLRYDPLTDTWTQSAVPSLNQNRHTAVWTGSEMILWGGGPSGTNSGGRYDPAADTWQPTSLLDAPSPRWGHTAVWTGSRMIVWGGSTTNTGGIYDPENDTWTPTSTLNAPEPRIGHAAVWTGSRMIVWGGVVPGVGSLVSGGQYDPVTDTWTSISTAGVPQGNSGRSAVWTGSEMILWGGSSRVVPETAVNSGARYDPAQDLWRPVSAEGAPPGRFNHAAVWTGGVMIVWGGELYYGGAAGGGRYDPVTDTWAPVATLNEPDMRKSFATVWTGDRMIVFGGRDPSPFGLRNLPTGGRYDPVQDVWTPTASTANGLTPRQGHRAVWTGNEMIVWGGCETHFDSFADGRRYDPLTDSWRSVNIVGAPERRCEHGMVWTGDRMLVWGGNHRTFVNQILGTGAGYDPLSDTWLPITDMGAPSARSNHTTVWTGDRMIVWGGGGWGWATNTGALYDPAADHWTPMTVVNAPEGRYAHSATWAGDRMVVWGGDTGSATGKMSHGDGGRYDPVSDTWQPVSLAGSPGPRVNHVTAWTGEEVFVFSGTTCLNGCQGLNSGALYDPVLDTWRPMSETGAPLTTFQPTGVWTGHEVLAWGMVGLFQNRHPLGGRYDPGTDSWRPMSDQNAPSGLTTVTAVWTGNHMIVYGGAGYGGRYVAFRDPDDDADGYGVCAGDCDDADRAVHPGAAELPGDIVDENCDGRLTCDPGATWKSRGQFVGCVARACDLLVDSGARTREECDALVSRAARLAMR